MSTTSKSKRQSPRSDKELLVETMIEAADDALFLQRGAADETTIEFGHSDHDEDDLLSFDHNNPMFHLKRNLDQDFCDSSTDSYWEDEKKSAGPKWDVTLANSVEVLKSHLRESSESRWTGKTVPESPKFHEIKPRPLPKSTQEQEEEEMKQIKPFQARNAPRFEKPNMETKPSPATTPQPFHFHSTTRKRPISVPPSKEDVDLQECQQFRFKARPIPKSVLLTSTKSPEVSRIPRLSLPSASQKSASRIPRSSHSLQLAPKITSKPSRIPRSTPSSKVEKICVEMEIKTMRVEFHMTSNEHAERQPTARNVALPLQLNCLERHEAFKQKQAEKLREEEKKNRQMACFKARPLPASMQKRRVVSQSPKIIGNAPKVIARIPKSSPRYSIKSPSKPVEETKAAEEEDLFFDTEQFVPKAHSRAVVVRLIQITSTVVILHLIVWYGTSPEYLWQIHRQFRDETVNSASFDGWPQVTYETENVPQYLAKATEILHPFASPINEAPRSEDVSLTANSDVALKYVLNVAENDVAFNQSIDTAENTGLVKEAQRGIPAQDDSVERLKLSHNDVSPEKTKAKAARAKVQHYFEGLTLADPESIHRAALQRVTSQNTKAHIVGPKTRLEDEDHAHDVTLDHPESSAKLPDEAEPVRRRAGIYFDFLQGFITPDVPQSKERRIRPQKSAGSDYHVQRWLDLSIDELMVLNGMFGVRLDSSFQKDVYRLE
ncbi:hypothetical protein FisN_22Lh028 [Fistulifera solaris]|uniref:Uncharacterized protein n=1 Tax=Fistulifera solaris TaxID=1519565 RepID=A0A1Z5JC47_FISSO|nr:hypothetical protein FisN_22Lh028 [Fistulifera solaris]|eukprot:GAX11358.1 hypothetical protein FisN_22Lh028 [Fistulifera solaris]